MVDFSKINSERVGANTEVIAEGIKESWDSIVNAVTTISPLHSKIHEGNAFNANHKFIDIANDDSVTLTIDIPADTRIHLQEDDWVPSNASVEVDLFRNPTIDAAGSDVDVVSNLNDGDRDTTVTIQQGATTTDDGTLVVQNAASGDKTSAATSETTALERVLQSDTTYLVRVTNVSTSNNTIDFLYTTLIWYE